ncbi:hypothetical protein ACFX16_032782 [Malus domestica]
MYELAQHVEQYDYLVQEEKILKPPSQGMIYKNPTVSYASAEGKDPQYVSIDVAEIVLDKQYVCKALAHINSKDAKTRLVSKETVKTSKVYTFDITKADIDKGKLKFPKKKMIVDVDPFPLATVRMVDAYLPKNKRKGKAEFVLIRHVPKKNSRPRLKIDLFSNEPPTEFSGSAIIESISNTNVKETEGSMVLCSSCKACIVLTEPKEKLPQVPTPRQSSKAAATPSKELSGGQCQKVFDRLGP